MKNKFSVFALCVLLVSLGTAAFAQINSVLPKLASVNEPRTGIRLVYSRDERGFPKSELFIAGAEEPLLCLTLEGQSSGGEKSYRLTLVFRRGQGASASSALKPEPEKIAVQGRNLNFSVRRLKAGYSVEKGYFASAGGFIDKASFTITPGAKKIYNISVSDGSSGQALEFPLEFKGEQELSGQVNMDRVSTVKLAMIAAVFLLEKNIPR